MHHVSDERAASVATTIRPGRLHAIGDVWAFTRVVASSVEITRWGVDSSTGVAQHAALVLLLLLLILYFSCVTCCLYVEAFRANEELCRLAVYSCTEPLCVCRPQLSKS